VIEMVEWADFVVAVCLVYVVIVWLRDARARLALVGVGLVGAVWLLASEMGLTLTARLLQAAFFVSGVVLLLVFQEDLRRSFERLAILVLRRGRPSPGDGVVDTVARAVFALAALRRGALIVLPGREPIERHVQGGVILNGLVSEPLLLSLFDPHSPGHDGAVIVAADRAQRFAVHLPLSSNFELLGHSGTRHAAALGLSESCDALTVVVSEERGTVAVAERGSLRTVTNAAQLSGLLRAASGGAGSGERDPLRRRRVAFRHARQALLALAIGTVLWVLLIPGSRVSQATLVVPVEVDNLPAGYDLGAVSPPDVRVTVTGVRRALFFLQPRDLHVKVDVILAQLGRRSFEILPQSVRCPPGVAATAVDPERVEISVRRSGQATPGPSPAPGL
jgi:diadenylate cyclase